jgi:hypothetical protein
MNHGFVVIMQNDRTSTTTTSWYAIERQTDVDLPRMVVTINNTRVRSLRDVFFVMGRKPLPRKLFMKLNQSIFAEPLIALHKILSPLNAPYMIKQSTCKQHEIHLRISRYKQASIIAKTSQELINTNNAQVIASFTIEIEILFDKSGVEITTVEIKRS